MLAYVKHLIYLHYLYAYSLPQTGNSKSNAGILAGSALVATMASLGIAYNKKKRNA